MRESRVSDAGYGIANGHGGQAATLSVFINCFISTTYVLNGRKVIA